MPATNKGHTLGCVSPLISPAGPGACPCCAPCNPYLMRAHPTFASPARPPVHLPACLLTPTPARAPTCLQLTFIGFLLHGVTQLASLLSWSSLPLSEKSQRVGSIFFAASIWLLPTLAPALYMRYRKEALIL